MRGSSNFARGGSRTNCRKNSSDNGFSLSFLSPQLILQFYSGLSIVYIKGNYNFPRFQRGVQQFPGEGGSSFFQGGWGGPNANIYRNPSDL